jgi:DNA polymerase-3 subunit delta'
MILGHKFQIELLEKMLQKKEIPHALLFFGPEGIGKKTVAIYFLEKILQKNPFSHPDFCFVFPQKNEIKIDQIREMIWKLSLSSFSQNFKTAILDDCHLMNVEAQNCLLKFLEEPKGKTILILITAHPEMLLKTIISRCQTIRFFPPSKKEIEEFLREKGLKEKEIEEMIKFSFSKPKLIFSFLENRENLTNLKSQLSRIYNLIKSPIPKKIKEAEILAKDEKILEILSVWLLYFREIFLKTIFERKEEKTLKAKFALQKLLELIFLIENTNINKRLAVENFLLQI